MYNYNKETTISEIKRQQGIHYYINIISNTITSSLPVDDIHVLFLYAHSEHNSNGQPVNTTETYCNRDISTHMIYIVWNLKAAPLTHRVTPKL